MGVKGLKKTTTTTTTTPIEIDTFPMKTQADPEIGVLYDIIGIRNSSTTMIFTEVKLHIDSPVKIKSIQIKRLKHPSFYAEKTAKQLRPLVFPINLIKEEEDNNHHHFLFRSGTLDYVHPKTSRYYLIKVTPLDKYPEKLCYQFTRRMI